MALLHKGLKDVLGLNARTLHYTTQTNTRAAARIANNKLKTKKALQVAGIPVPRLFGIIHSRQELRRFRWTKLPSSFVLKPNNASGGGGIIVVFGRNKKGNWVKADKSEVFIPELKNHILDILDGSFTLGNIPDLAFFEQRISNHASLKPYSVRGIPDIRILVYNQVPIMAMLRLPTAESAGRANLHSGGVGVGVDIVHGLTTRAIHHGRLIESLPGGRQSLSGFRVPYWNDILLLASRAARAVGLNYAGVDIAIDREDGPLVLELNARPGLAIQFANMAPLKSRLRRVEGLKIASPEKGVNIARNLFSEEVESEIEDITGRTVIGIEETVSLIDSEGQAHPLLAKIDTGAYRTTIDETLAKKYDLHTNVVGYRDVRGALGEQTRPIIDLTLKLRHRVIKTKAFVVDRAHMNYDAIIGRRDLKGFLVDPAKPSEKHIT